MTKDFNNLTPPDGNSGEINEATRPVGKAVCRDDPDDLTHDDDEGVGDDFAARENLLDATPSAPAYPADAADPEIRSAPTDGLGAARSPARQMLEERVPLCEEAWRQLALSNGAGKVRLVAFLQSVLDIRRSNDYDQTEVEVLCRDRGIPLTRASKKNPMLLIIKLVSPGVDPKAASQYALAVQFALTNDTAAEDFPALFDACGGVQGCVKKLRDERRASRSAASADAPPAQRSSRLTISGLPEKLGNAAMIVIEVTDGRGRFVRLAEAETAPIAA